MTDLPHIGFPWALGPDGRVIVHEQDSVEAVASCVGAIATCIVGQAPLMPTFGVLSPLFDTVPLNLTVLVEAVAKQEPRAAYAATASPDEFSAAIQNIALIAQVAEGPA